MEQGFSDLRVSKNDKDLDGHNNGEIEDFGRKSIILLLLFYYSYTCVDKNRIKGCRCVTGKQATWTEQLAPSTSQTNWAKRKVNRSTSS